MVDIADILDWFADNPSVALGLAVIWALYQVYAPKYLGVTTRLSPLFNVPERMDSVESSSQELYSKLRELDEKQVHHIQVTRAQARAIDPDTEVTMSSEDVDEYLVDNGVPVAVLTKPANEVEDGSGEIEVTTSFIHEHDDNE